MKNRLSPQERIELGPDSTWNDPGDSNTDIELAQAIRERLLKVAYLEKADLPAISDKTPEILVADGTLLALSDHEDLLFPAFQFDSDTKQPIEVVTQINLILDAPHDGWGATAWWVSVNGRLPEDTSPLQMLGNTALHPILLQLAEGTVIDD